MIITSTRGREVAPSVILSEMTLVRGGSYRREGIGGGVECKRHPRAGSVILSADPLVRRTTPHREGICRGGGAADDSAYRRPARCTPVILSADPLVRRTTPHREGICRGCGGRRSRVQTAGAMRVVVELD